MRLKLFAFCTLIFISLPKLIAQDHGYPCQQAFNYEVADNDYGSTILKVTPYVKAPCGFPVSDKRDMYKLWGVLVCYNLDGEQKVKRQDMTYDIKSKGFYQLYLSYSAKSEVSDVQLYYFDASKDSDTYPEKSCSFFEKR